jgi:phospholipid transport system transporter-binding protein
MTMVEIQRDAQGRFQLVGELTFRSIPELLQRARLLFNEADAIEVDLCQINRSDSAGLALLVEWMRNAQRDQKSIRFLNMPTKMLEIARSSSLDQILPLERG